MRDAGGDLGLLAVLDRDASAVQQAIWSGSGFLAAIFHSGISSEGMLADLEARLEKVDSESLRESIASHRAHFFSETVGFRALLDRLASTPTPRLQSIMKWGAE